MWKWGVWNPDLISFDKEIINKIIHKENQEEEINFDIISEEVKTVLSELVGNVEDQISKFKNKNLTRKRQRSEDNWARNKRQKSHQQRKSYINSEGKQIHGKSIKTTKNCKNACQVICATTIDKVAQEKIFHHFCEVDIDGKHSFMHQISVALSIASNPTPQKRNKCYSHFFR